MALKFRGSRVRVSRDQAELEGTARVGATEVLRSRPGTGDGVQPGSAAGVAGEGFCRDCDQAVKPVGRRFWGKAALLVAVAQLVAVIVSVVACFTAVDPWKGYRRRLVAWPAAIHPAGLGVAAAVVAALAAAWLADFLNERADVCPDCRSSSAAQTR